MNRLLRPVFARCGWTPAANEGVPVKNLRSTLISTLGAFDDPATVRGCQERFAAFLKDPGALPPDLRSAALTVVGRHADAATYDTLLALARKAPSDEEKNRYYAALTSVNDPSLARRTLALTLTDELPPVRALRTILNVAESGEQVDAALAFTLEHLDAILAKAPPLVANLFVPELFAACNDVRRAEELEALARRPGSTMDATEVKKAAERIRTAADLKGRVLPEAARWAAANGDAGLP